VWYGYDGSGGLKGPLCRLVGFLRPSVSPESDELCTSRSYDIAYESIYEALPDCKVGCACSSVLVAMLGIGAQAILVRSDPTES
ncbi:hypothetical protein B7486_76180, partial [cyanobacterium TDX16]